METKNIAHVTLKEVFEKSLGRENAREILSKIQDQYDRGLRGKDLENYAIQEIDKYSTESKSFLIAAVAAILIF